MSAKVGNIYEKTLLKLKPIGNSVATFALLANFCILILGINEISMLKVNHPSGRNE